MNFAQLLRNRLTNSWVNNIIEQKFQKNRGISFGMSLLC